MRPIKFRGMNKSRESWFYGSLTFYGETPFIVGPVVESCEEYIAFEFWNPVDPETVGEFTGLRDKNGKEIYEGDIAFDDGGKVEGIRYMGVIVFGEWNGSAMFYLNTSIFGTPERLMLTKHTQVLGNIYENPELLK